MYTLVQQSDILEFLQYMCLLPLLFMTAHKAMPSAHQQEIKKVPYLQSY